MLRTLVLLLATSQIFLIYFAQAQTIDTIRVGDGTIPPGKLMAGQYVIDNYRVKEGVQELRSVTTQTITLDTLDMLPVYHVSFEHASATDTTYSMITARQSDYSLMFHQVKGKHDSTSVAIVGHHVSGWVALPDQPI